MFVSRWVSRLLSGARARPARAHAEARLVPSSRQACLFSSGRRAHRTLLLSALLLACTPGRTRPKQKPKPSVAQQDVDAPAMPTKLAPSSVEQRLPRMTSELRWLALGGGSDPLSNQISLAQDLELVTSLLAGRGLTLFASGAGALVSVERPELDLQDSEPSPPAARGNSLARQRELGRVAIELAKLLGPPGALQVRYEPATLAIDAPATRDHVLDALRAALESGNEPLLVVAASHGERGSVARQNSLALWGGWPVDVEDVAAVLDGFEQARPTRWVITACYGGGFAELAFVGANPHEGPRAPQHCGLFAAPWDDESSGCDPNPDRRKQESFTIHFLAALRGEGRDGADRLAEIDLDRDARVGLAEAHAWARIHSRSFDVPTSTSERYLREYARSYEGERGSVAEGDLEELSVVRALSAELELDDEPAARDKLRELERILADASALRDDAQQTADDSFYALRVALLERWPLLDHSWDPRAQALVAREGTRILQLLTSSDLARGNELAARELDEASVQHDGVRIARARVLRLVRAYENLRLASNLRRRGGPRYAHYEALRRCERYVPEVRAPLRRAELQNQPRISQAVEPEAHAK
jgi:hypothetical protein